MTAFIKSIKSWETLAHGEPISFTDLPIMSNDNCTGDMVFRYDRTFFGTEGSWLVYGTRLWIVKAVKPDLKAGTVTLTLADAYNAFYRKHTIFSSSSTGAFMRTVFRNSYLNQSDTEYAMPYLTVTNTDSSPLYVPPLENGVLFCMQDYIREVSKLGVRTSVAPKTVGQGVDITISTRSTERETVEFTGGHAQLVSNELSVDFAAKYTVVVNGVNNFYYLQADGSISQSPPSPRISGRWETVAMDADEPIENNLRALFSRNTASRKIEFYSDKYYEFGTPLRILADGQVIEADVSYVACSMGDPRFHYKAGDLPTTLSEKLRLALK